MYIYVLFGCRRKRARLRAPYTARKPVYGKGTLLGSLCALSMG